jgi:Flp pilus assembly protein TadB
MTRDTIIVIFCIVVLLGAAWFGYRVFFDSPSDAARQHEEALKRAQLEADLIKAVAAARAGRARGTPARLPNHAPHDAANHQTVASMVRKNSN